jgi:hypothetical protein
MRYNNDPMNEDIKDPGQAAGVEEVKTEETTVAAEPLTETATAETTDGNGTEAEVAA